MPKGPRAHTHIHIHTHTISPSSTQGEQRVVCQNVYNKRPEKGGHHHTTATTATVAAAGHGLFLPAGTHGSPQPDNRSSSYYSTRHTHARLYENMAPAESHRHRRRLMDRIAPSSSSSSSPQLDSTRLDLLIKIRTAPRLYSTRLY